MASPPAEEPPLAGEGETRESEPGAEPPEAPRVVVTLERRPVVQDGPWDSTSTRAPGSAAPAAAPEESPGETKNGWLKAFAGWIEGRLEASAPWLGATAALAASALPLWRLYRRLSRKDVLAAPTRRQVYERVQTTPGETAGGLARALGVAQRTVSHHLDVLTEFGLVEGRRIGKRFRFYENGGRYTDLEKRAHVALASEKARKVLAALERFPRASFASIAEETGFPKSTVQWHVERFRKLGILDAAERTSGGPERPARTGAGIN